jgi:segregation and condensation protein A
MNGKKKRTADRRNAGRRRSAHLHSYKKSVLMICTVLVFLSGVLAVGAVKLYAKNNAYKAQEEELAAQIKEEEKRSEEVKEYAEPVDLDELLGDLTLKKLNEIFKEVMKRQVDKIDPVRSKFGKIEKEEVTVSDKFIYIHEYMHTHHKFSFRQLLEKQKSKMHIVVTFLAVLEMMKLGEIRVEQEETCGEIMIERVEEAYGN